MMSAHPLQLFWEGLTQGLGMCLWEFLTMLPDAHFRDQTLMLEEKA